MVTDSLTMAGLLNGATGASYRGGAMMLWDPALNSLRDVLADLYQTEEDARQVVVAAGLDSQRIAFSNKAVNTWTSILTYAHNNDQVDAVLRTARGHFSRNARLAAAEQEWLASRSRQPPGGMPSRPEPASESRAIGRAATQVESSHTTGNSPRNLIINEVRLSDEQVGELERLYHTHMQDAAYWYDRGSWRLGHTGRTHARVYSCWTGYGWAATCKCF